MGIDRFTASARSRSASTRAAYVYDRRRVLRRGFIYRHLPIIGRAGVNGALELLSNRSK